MAEPAAPTTSAAAEEEDDNGLAPEEEAQVDFAPVVELKEVEKNTGEDEEEALKIGDAVKLRAKLFRWESDTWEKEKKMWKERGTGDVKFLKHKGTGKVRLLMRREKTMKICANFYTEPSIELKENAGSDRSWVWQCMDFSEEKSDISVLAIRFANSENAQSFKAVFDDGKEANKKLGGGAAPAAASDGAAVEKKDDGKKEDEKEGEKEGEAAPGTDEATAALDAVKLGDEKKEEPPVEAS